MPQNAWKRDFQKDLSQGEAAVKLLLEILLSICLHYR